MYSHFIVVELDLLDLRDKLVNLKHFVEEIHHSWGQVGAELVKVIHILNPMLDLRIITAQRDTHQ